MSGLIELKNVTYTYPLSNTPAIKNLSLTIEKGDFYGVIGANGAGKTTFCALLCGFAPSFFKGELQGEILINGIPTTEYEEGQLLKLIGYVFQNPFNQISGAKDTVFEEIAYGLENYGVPVEKIEERVTNIMRLTGIEELAFKNPYALSGGQQQRVALASILVLEPEILIIDEPTSQLDPEGTESVFRIIAELKKEKRTVILVEQKVDLVAEYSDKIIAIDKGELVAVGDKQSVLSDETLLKKGIQLPQYAILCNELKKRGMEIDYIPITEKQAVEVLGKLTGVRSR